MKKIGLGGIPDINNIKITINFWFIKVFLINPAIEVEDRSLDKMIIIEKEIRE